MNCYLINNETGLVENTIVADPAIDPAPEGYSLVPMEEIISVEESEIPALDAGTDTLIENTVSEDVQPLEQ